MKKLKVLVVTAHADDLEAHCSGFVLKLLDEGHDIDSVVTTFGPFKGMISDEKANVVRRRESAYAHSHIGLIPDFGYATYEQDLNVDQHMRGRFKKFIMDINPDVIITHWPIDVNPDHRATAILTMESAYQLGVNTEILFFEAISSGRATKETRPQTMCFYPTHYCSITPELNERKWQLLRYHESQDPENMIFGQEELQKSRGAEVGVPQAEAYIAGKRVGLVLPELASILTPTPFSLPKGIGASFKAETIGIAA